MSRCRNRVLVAAIAVACGFLGLVPAAAGEAQIVDPAGDAHDAAGDIVAASVYVEGDELHFVTHLADLTMAPPTGGDGRRFVFSATIGRGSILDAHLDVAPEATRSQVTYGGPDRPSRIVPSRSTVDVGADTVHVAVALAALDADGPITTATPLSARYVQTYAATLASLPFAGTTSVAIVTVDWGDGGPYFVPTWPIDHAQPRSA